MLGPAKNCDGRCKIHARGAAGTPAVVFMVFVGSLFGELWDLMAAALRVPPPNLTCAPVALATGYRRNMLARPKRRTG